MGGFTGNADPDPGSAERRSGIAPNGKPYESVWDYPRPPALDRVEWNIRVVHDGIEVVNAPWAARVLETSQPPAYYVDPEFVDIDRLVASTKMSFCEWKGMATYASIEGPNEVAADACWTYQNPTPRFASITGFWAFYAQALEGCFVDEENVLPNPGNFYGGWVTAQITGPVKGAPGTAHW